MNITVKNCDRKYYEELRRIGYRGVDFSFGGYAVYDEMMEPDYAEKCMERYRAIIGTGLELSQTHLTYRPSAFLPADGGNYPDYEVKLLPLLEKQLRITAEMGCKVAVFHPYYELGSEVNTRRGNITLIEKLMPLLEKTGIVLAEENVYGPKCCHAHHSTAEELLYYPEYFNSKHLGICLDTGHAVIRGQDPVQMLEKVGPWLAALHLHTTLPGTDIHTVPYLTNQGERIDWAAFYRALRKTGYTGAFNMELKVPPALSYEAACLFYRLAYTVARDIMGGA